MLVHLFKGYTIKTKGSLFVPHRVHQNQNLIALLTDKRTTLDRSDVLYCYIGAHSNVNTKYRFANVGYTSPDIRPSHNRPKLSNFALQYCHVFNLGLYSGVCMFYRKDVPRKSPAILVCKL